MVYLHQTPKSNDMNKLLFFVAAVAVITAMILGIELHNKRLETIRLERNQEALLSDIETFKTEAERWAASADILELEVRELRKARKEDIKKIRELGIRLKDAESYARSIAQNRSSATLPLRDTIIMHDTVQMFSSQHGHTELHGIIRSDSLSYTLKSTDTLYQVVHRIPHRFLFIRFGTKAIRQTVWSSNPNTRIVYSEYIEFKQQQEWGDKFRAKHR